MPIHQSFSWWCFTGRGLEPQPLLAGAKAIGYEAVELLPESLVSLACDEGLVVASHNGHQSIDSGLNDPSQHDRIEQELLSNLDLAVRYKIPNLIVLSGARREGLSDQQGIEYSAKILSKVAKPAEDAGVNLVLELLNSKVDHPGYQCDTTAWGVSVCEMVGSPRVKLLYDIYHMQIMEGDIIRTIKAQSKHIAHYHTAGNPGRRDMDDAQELNYPPIMRAILETGYDRYVGHEFIPKGDLLQALKAAYDLCDL
jgi:hydroxypyruvate isomerase